jgi:hypothetical protein
MNLVRSHLLLWSAIVHVPLIAGPRPEQALSIWVRVEQGVVAKVPLGVPSAVAFPAFVVWRNNKPRVVIDMRRVNKCLFPNAYPLPRQDAILSAIGGAMVFSSLNFVKSFFQQPIREEDQ